VGGAVKGRLRRKFGGRNGEADLESGYVDWGLGLKRTGMTGFPYGAGGKAGKSRGGSEPGKSWAEAGQREEKLTVRIESGQRV